LIAAVTHRVRAHLTDGDGDLLTAVTPYSDQIEHPVQQMPGDPYAFGGSR
jgi:hypothetical protein